MTGNKLERALKKIASAFDVDVRALKKRYLQEIGALQKQADEEAVKKVHTSLRKKI